MNRCGSMGDEALYMNGCGVCVGDGGLCNLCT